MCNTLYHAGLTSDLLSFLEQDEHAQKLFLIGFSLGGNVALKAAAEICQAGEKLLAGVVSVNTPIDLAACSRRLQQPVNRIYQDRFTARMKERLLRTGRYSQDDLAGCRTVFDIDDKIKLWIRERGQLLRNAVGPSLRPLYTSPRFNDRRSGRPAGSLRAISEPGAGGESLHPACDAEARRPSRLPLAPRAALLVG